MRKLLITIAACLICNSAFATGATYQPVLYDTNGVNGIYVYRSNDLFRMAFTNDIRASQTNVDIVGLARTNDTRELDLSNTNNMIRVRPATNGSDAINLDLLRRSIPASVTVYYTGTPITDNAITNSLTATGEVWKLDVSPLVQGGMRTNPGVAVGAYYCNNIYTGATYTIFPATVINVKKYCSENSPGNASVKEEIYRFEPSTSNWIEWGEAAAADDVVDSAIPQKLEWTVPVSTIVTNIPWMIGTKTKRIGGTLTPDLIVGYGSNMPSIVQWTAPAIASTATNQDLTPYAKTNDSRGMTLDGLVHGSNWWVNAGKFGIGTNNPTLAFEVSGNSNNPAIRIHGLNPVDETYQEIRNNLDHTFLTYQGGSSLTTTIAGVRQADMSWLEGSGSNVMFSSSPANPAPLIFAPNRTEAMRITSAGNIGMGTNNPAVKSHVVGQTRLEGIGAFAPNVLTIRNSENVAYAPYAIFNTGNGAADYQADRTGFTNYILAIGTRMGGSPIFGSIAAAGQVVMATDQGNVGVGTTNPATKLDCNGASTFRGLIDAKGNNITNANAISATNLTAGTLTATGAGFVGSGAGLTNMPETIQNELLNGVAGYAFGGAYYSVVLSDTDAWLWGTWNVKSGGTYKVQISYYTDTTNTSKTMGGTLYMMSGTHGGAFGAAWNVFNGVAWNISLPNSQYLLQQPQYGTTFTVGDNTAVTFSYIKSDNAGGAAGNIYMKGAELVRQ